MVKEGHTNEPAVWLSDVRKLNVPPQKWGIYNNAVNKTNLLRVLTPVEFDEKMYNRR